VRRTLRCIGALAAALLCVAVVGACGGDDDSAQSLPAADDGGGDDSGGDDSGGEDSGDDNGGGDNGGGGAPGIPGGGSGGGAAGAPIEIPPIQEVGALDFEDALDRLKAGIRAQCPRGDVCLVLQEEKTGDGERCTFGGTKPPSTEPGTFVKPDSTVVVFGTCEAGAPREGEQTTEGEGETGGEGETDTGTDSDTETDTDGEGETEGTP
jgi:hypothetical protein